LLIKLTTIDTSNTCVCHYQKGGDCWNKGCFSKSPLEF